MRLYLFQVLQLLLLVVLAAHALSALAPGRCPTVERRRKLLLTSIASLLQQPVFALSPEDASSQYDRYASSYDRLDGGQASNLLGIDEARADILRQAKGSVLEVGVGTGLNLEKYVGSQLTALTMVDISDGMLRQAKERSTTLTNLRNVPIAALQVDATRDLVTKFGPDSFDTVVDTFSLCVMGNQGAVDCLDQMSRVVKNTGRILLVENSRASNPLLGLYQDATADAAAVAGGKGCVYNQNVAGLIQKTGRLRILQEQSYLAGIFRGFVCERIA